MLFKRSVSTLIATILLIVVSVILITVVLTWAKGFTQSTTNKATDLLDQSKDISKTGVFWQTSLLGDQLILRNQISDDIEIKGYKILTNDYNSDYFWLNSYRSLENNILFSPSTLVPITLVCMPTNKFYLELIDINDQSYTLEINPINNRSFTSCNTFNVPLWEFEELDGSYTINTFTKSSGNLINNGTFDLDTGWNKSGDVLPTISGGTANFNNLNNNGYFYQTNVVQNNKKYRISFDVINYSSGQLYLRVAGANSQQHALIVAGDGHYDVDVYVGVDVVYADTSIRFYALSDGNGFVGSIDNISVIEIDPLETITDGTKYLESIITGNLLIPSPTVYGTWEFDVFTNVGSYSSFFLSNSDLTTEGYSIDFGYRIRLYRFSGPVVLFYTDPSFPMKNNTWYKFKIIRKTNGEFTVLIKGANLSSTPNYGGWYLVPTNNGTNPSIDNTHKSFTNLILILRANDRIANIKITPEIDQ